MSSIPIVYNDYDTVVHRRDPRAKLLAFTALAVLLYVVPTWKWMVVLSVLGLAVAAAARVPAKWLAVLWAVQLPNLLGILAWPAIQRVLAGQPPLAGSFALGLKLSLSWTAAMFLGAGVFTSMRITELVDGLRRLHVPEFVCFTIEYVFLLFYVVVNDIVRVVNAMKVKGLDIETRNPLRLLRSLPSLGVPAIFAVLRRANTMMAVLKMRGYPLDEVETPRNEMGFDAGDAALLALTGVVVAVSVAARAGVLDVSLLAT